MVGSSKRLRVARLVMMATALLTCLLAPGNASGSLALPVVVSSNPADFTPHIVDGGGVQHTEIYALAQQGPRVYAGGHFMLAQSADRAQNFTRSHLMSFEASTGVITPFAPRMDGAVTAVEPMGQFLFVGGEFTTVNGVPRRGIAKIHAVTGQVDPAFNAGLDGNVSEIRLVGSRLLVAGKFSRTLVALDPVTGSATGYIQMDISGTVAPNAGRTHIDHFAVNPAGTRLVAIGNFQTVAGHPRQRAFMLNLGTRSTSLNPWYYPPLTNMCRSERVPDYLRDVDFSPNGDYFVLAANGFLPRAGGIGRDLCDAAARFETAVATPRRPTWINYTGGDTLHSIAATGTAVYIQGHMRNVNSPLFVGGTRAPVPRASRLGIAALHSGTGQALAWNPGKTRGIGGKEFLVTGEGLWVGSDGERFAGEIHDNLAFCPR
jgi:hypothetical protein